LNGSVDSVAIYSRALSLEEVEDLYDSKKADFVEYKEGVNGNAIEFDGVDDYVVIDPDLNYSDNTPFSISLWLNPYEDLDKQNAWTRIVDHVNSGGTKNGFVILTNGNEDIGGALPSKGVLFMEVWDSAGNQHSMYWKNTTPNTIPSNTWSHITGVVDINNCVMNFYINGELFSFYRNKTCSSYNVPENTSMYLGMLKDWGGNFNGSIDELGIYSKALSPEEVEEIYESQKVKFIELKDKDFEDRKTKILLNFDEDFPKDNSIYDREIIVNGPNKTTEGCLSGGCYFFDGDDDEIVFSDGDMELKYGDMTFTAWINGSGIIASKCDSTHECDSSSGTYSISTSGSALRMFIEDVWSTTTSSGVLNSNEWNFVAFSYDASDRIIKIYSNGNNISTTDRGPDGYSDDEINIYLGSTGGWSGSNFNGYMDEVAIYSKVLTDEEIKALYRAQKALIINNQKSEILELDGVDDYVDIDYDDSFNLYDKNHTMYIDFFKSVYGDAFRKSNNYYMGVSSGLCSGGVIYGVYYTSGAIEYICSNSKIKPDKRYAVTNIFDRNNMYVYLNTIKENESVWTHGNIYTSGTDVQIGRYNPGWNYYEGEIENIRFYSEAISETDIKNLFWNTNKIVNRGLNMINLSSCNLNQGTNYTVKATIGRNTYEKDMILN
jgi:hypothetical protein